MSVLKEYTNVLRTVTTILALTHVVVMLGTRWTPMGVVAVTLMSVLLIRTAVLRTVKTLLVHTLVVAMLGIVLMSMGMGAMVSLS